MASKDYSDDNKAMRARTEKLRALRLAKEAADAQEAAPAAAKKPAKKKVAKGRVHAPWPW
jgi:hypothetical protein